MLSRVTRALICALSTCSLALGAPVAPEPTAASAQASSADPTAGAKPKKHKKKRKKKSEDPSAGARSSKSKRSRGRRAAPTSGFVFRSSAGLGFSHGYGVRRFDSPLVQLKAQGAPWRSFGPVRLELPLDYQQFLMPSGGLREHHARAALRGTLRLAPALEPFAEGELTGVWRPDWPDLYQPSTGDELLRTDRFSYVKMGATVGWQGSFGRETKARVAYSYGQWDYRTDPAFQPITSPNHLTPSDHEEHALELSIGTSFGKIRPRLRLALFERNYFFVFARDRLNGKTHTSPGGLPPNPLYATRGAEPELSLMARAGNTTLRAAFGVQATEDVFQGYYSSLALHPSLSGRWAATKSLSFELGGELWLRRYGANSYAAGPSHPALTFGDRRADRRLDLRFEARLRLSEQWFVAATTSAAIRRTNFPAYVPNVFPRFSRYDINWNYDNWQQLVALEYRPRGASPDGG